MRVALRTDASLQIGMGHFMRCLALARGLRAAGAQCRFICRDLPGHAADRIRAEGFETLLLPAPDGPAPNGPSAHAPWAGVGWEEDAAQTRAALGDPPDWLVVDHYAFEARWEKAARPAGTRLMAIDDLADRDHACDLLLDQNLGREAADYDGRVPDQARRLIGPRHALLRPEFAQARVTAQAGRAGRGLGRILVTMGGVDQADATSAVLEALRTAPLPPGLRLCVVMGARAPALDGVRALARQMPWPTEVCVDVADMAALMAEADLAITAGGGTTWERCCLGLPGVIVQVADNQAGILRAMVAAGAALDPGPLRAPGFAAALRAQVAQAARDLEALSQATAALCDGAGVGRVVRQMLTLGATGPAEWQVRRAVRADAADVWHWRHADRAERFFRNPVLTPLHQHLAWFETALASDRRLMLMVGQHGQTLGHVRFDRDPAAPDLAEISLCLNPACRGEGLAGPILAAALDFAREDGLRRFRAQAHRDNAASLALFARAGFAITGQEGPFRLLDLPDPAPQPASPP